MKLFRIISLFVFSLPLTGCCDMIHSVVSPFCPDHAQKIMPYNGPTESIDQVVDAINTNNAKIPSLYAHHTYDADVVDDKHDIHHVSGDGVLLYMSPSSVRLKANAIIGNVFEIGTNHKFFWVKFGHDAGDTMWWGLYEKVGRLNFGQSAIPIRPDMVLDVLGVAIVNNDFMARPVPTMRFDPFADAYVFVWNDRAPDRWLAVREVWYDRATKLPKLVLFYDVNGRVVVRAEFNNPAGNIDGRPQMNKNFYRQLEVAGLPKEQWPWIPGTFNLFFPENGSRFAFTLSDAVVKDPGPPLVPQERSFTMPDPQNAGVNHVFQLK